MRNHRLPLPITVVLSLAFNTFAATLYVDLNCTNPVPPYSTWATAATNIQVAVDEANPADLILVTNGVYQTGGRVVYGATTNRVAVTGPITVQSVNGPSLTVIQGYQTPGLPNGSNAVRCVYLATNAVLNGFTLTDGATRSNGDYDREQSGGGAWCESTDARLENCTITGNAAWEYGGAVYSGTVRNCTISSNSAAFGGGAFLSSLTNCTFTANSARTDGGGAASSWLSNCRLRGNSSDFTGGGVSYSTVDNCVISGNWAEEGGGAYFCDANNCTITGNRASQSGGGALVGTVNNSIIYYNNAPVDPNNSGYTMSSQFRMNYCDTVPLPQGNGNVGNIAAEPELASATHLSSGSPCRYAGSPAYASGVDIDGEAWSVPFPIGCDEYRAGAITGALSAGMVASITNVTKGFTVDFTADIVGHAAASKWDFGDSTAVSNRPYASHSWNAAGDYPVVLRVYNESNPLGVTAAVVIHVVNQTHYVALNSTNPLAPYTSWATAATNIQDAVDAAYAGAVILVSNGVYAAGGRLVDEPYGRMTNRVAVTKPLTVQSVNGPSVTFIQGSQVPGVTNGDGAIRCVYLADGAALAGFTLTNGATGLNHNGGGLSGGGVYCESTNAFVSDCVIMGNSAGEDGGGAYYGTLNDCVLSSNSAWDSGGGVYQGTLHRCLITRNSGGGSAGGILDNCVVAFNSTGGGDSGSGVSFGVQNNCTIVGNTGASAGAYYSSLTNCIVYYNTGNYADNSYNSTLRNCCSTGFFSLGNGNITNEPLFVDLGSGNLRLQSNSPCINAGNNSSVSSSTDLDSRPRVVAGTVDIGAYECQDPGSSVFRAWLQRYGLPTDGSVDYIDTDNDLLNNWQEWQAGTDPTNAASVLKLLSLASTTNPPGLTITWQSSSGVTYYVQRSSDLSGLPRFLTIQSNIVGQAGTTSYTDTNAVGPGPYFYRVGAGTPPVPTVRCVDLNCTNPVPPYVDWNTAATNIQDAVDVANPGDLILVANGVYRTGGRIVYGVLTNRVALTKAVTLRSINGPAVTFIEGYQMPGTTNGDSAVRCVYLTNNAVLAGFTLTNGATRASGDTFREEHGGGVWCEFGKTTVSNCVLTANAAFNSGGGSWAGTLYDCILTGNRAQYAGGGAYHGTLNRCRLVGNWAGSFGGGAEKCTLDNCLLTSNSAVFNGGGAHNSKLNNCTIANNSASTGGGGASGGSTLSNSIVYYNAAPVDANIDVGSLYSCCTTPLYQPGFGNITNEPLFVDLPGGDLHLRAGSPCINAGNNSGVTSGTDLDGRPRIAGGTVDMGAYETAIHFVDLNSTNPTPPYWDWSTAATGIQDAVDVAGAGDQILVTNGVYQTGGRVVHGALTNRVAVTKAVTVQSVNGPEVTVIKGYQVPGTTNGDSAVRCVYLTNNAALIGFTLTNGATRGSGDQIHERNGGGVWCESTSAVVSNCVLARNSAQLILGAGGGAYSGTLNGCTLFGNQAAYGGGSMYSSLNHCLLYGNRASTGGGSSGGSLNNCTLTNNNAFNGGGVIGGALTNCILTGNSASKWGGGANSALLMGCVLSSNTAAAGGGAYDSFVLINCLLSGNVATGTNDPGGGGVWGGSLYNCLLTGNSAQSGGGAGYGRLYNCTVANNSASYIGGGTYRSGLYNSIIYYNAAPTDSNSSSSVAFYSCMLAQPFGPLGDGNLTNAPLFLDPANRDYRLQSNSPCINAGYNAYATITNDLDANARISGGTVDIGAYEFQNPASMISYAWLQQYGLPIDGTADYIDTDNDQMNNFQEWRAGTSPTNELSLLKMLTLSNDAAGTTVSWQSVGGVRYSVERSDLTGGAGFSAIQSNITGQAGTTSFSDTTARAAPRLYYRVGVQ